jgi:hypothetical protein
VSIDKSWRLRIDDLRRLGPDIRIESRPAKDGG